MSKKIIDEIITFGKTAYNVMIDQIHIQNFRGFSSLLVSDLRRVNLIVGPNSSGKTAFLESLFLSAGALAVPSVIFQLRALRHLGNSIEIAADAASYQSLWDDLFHWFDREKTISIDVVGSESRSLRAAYEEAASQLLPLGKQLINNPVLPQIVFEWRRGDSAPIVVKPTITGTGLTIQGASSEHFPVVLFSPHSPEVPEEHAKRFSDLSKIGESGPIVKGLRSEFPFLEGLSLEHLSGAWAVFAKLTGHERKLPVALLSDGINKLMGILLGIASNKRGLVLVDQIEDGFYFERMPSIWRLIYRFALDNDVQVFATCHSLEFLKAMHEIMRGNEEDFALLHAYRENGACNLRTTKGKFFEATLEQGFEVR